MNEVRFESIEAEQMLIGALLSNNIPIELQERDFSIAGHWDIFRKIQAGKKLLDFSGEQEFNYLRTACDSVLMPIKSNIENYAEIIREMARKRIIKQAAVDAIASLEMNDSSSVLANLNAKINETAEVKSVKNAKEIRQEIVNDMELPMERYATGLPCLDTAMSGGLYAGFMYGICGAEKAGKTTLAHTISFNLKCPHLYLAMEMGAKQIEQRNIARALGKNSLGFLGGTIEKNSVETAVLNQNIYYADAVGWSIEEIIHAVAMTKLKHGIKGFIVDYWQLISGQQKGDNEERHLRRAAQELANFSRKNSLWCILLAQMNKDGQLFGGNGLRKACDQLYMVETCGEYNEHGRWLRQDASRYTFREDVGSEQRPCLLLETGAGPHFIDIT
jgi:replicative DNA helicase